MAITLDRPRLFLGHNASEIGMFHIAGGTACAYTRRAPGKETDNEDSLGLIPCGENTGVLVVADGLGGLPSGEQASSTAVQQVSQYITASCGDQLALREAILDGIEQANRIIVERGTGSGTTIAAAGIENLAVRSRQMRPFTTRSDTWYPTLLAPPGCASRWAPKSGLRHTTH